MGYKGYNGLRQGTHKALMMGPGAIFQDFDLDKFDPSDPMNTAGDLLGATAGGNTIKINTEYHDVAVDGTLGPVEHLEWLIAATAQLETTLLEITKENLQLTLPNFDVMEHDENYDILKHNGEIAPSSYQNIAIVGNVVGSSYPVVFILNRARVISQTEIPLGNGKEDVALKMTFESRFTEADPYTIPFYIMYPKGGADLPDVKFSRPSGDYDNPISVSLSGPAGATIYYTADGSVPTPGKDKYSGVPIEVNETMTIKAVAFRGADASAIVVADYTIKDTP